MAEIHGLTLFRDLFADHADKYILIGGCALHTVMTEADLDARATKDLDIVLVVEAIDPAFVEHFWRFVDDGGYVVRQASEGQKRSFHRFQKPTDQTFPAMLELFTREPALTHPLAGTSNLTPVPVEDAVESLSAILLDTDYYDFILARRRNLMGLPYIGEECLIALKALAWMDLRARKAAGEAIDGKDVRKHLMDVFALSQVLSASSRFEVSARIRADIERFIDAARRENPDVARFGVTASAEQMLLRLHSAFVLKA